MPLYGAITRVAANDMAFALRRPGYEVDIVGLWTDPAEKVSAVQWVNSLRSQLQPFAQGVHQPTRRNQRRACPGGLRGKLRSTGRAQEKVRPWECPAAQSEHQARLGCYRTSE